MNSACAYLLNYAPTSWSTRDDMLLGLARGLQAKGILPVLVFSGTLPKAVQEPYRAVGAEVESINYREGRGHYFLRLKALRRKYLVKLAHVRYFRFSHPVPWLARSALACQIVYTDAEGGLLTPVVWKRKLLSLRAGWLAKPIRRFVAISQFVRSRLMDLGIADQRIEVIHNGVDLQRFRPEVGAREWLHQKFGVANDELILLIVSFLMKVKNIPLVLDACAVLQQRGVRFRLFVVGDGPLRSDLEKHCKEAGISSKAHWLGHIDNPVPWMQAADLFVLASVGEAFGNVLTEAMACGIPIVALDRGGIREVVQDGITGILVHSLDPADFADAMTKLGQNVELRRQMGRAGRKRAEERFALQVFVDRTLQLYERLEGNQS